MYRRKRTVTLVLLFAVLLAGLIFILWNFGDAKADGPPSPDPVTTATPTTDPCFRTDPECYDQVQEQLPEEVIGRQIDCPDGSVGRIVDVDGNNTCSSEVPTPPLDASTTPRVSKPTDTDIFATGALAGGIVVAIALSLVYFAFRAPKFND
jgi:hypothetical protein